MDRDLRRRRRRSQTSCIIVALAVLALLIVVVIVVIVSLNRGFFQPAPLETPLITPETTTTPAPPQGTPSLEVLRVNPGQSVTIRAQNFPANASVAVLIGPAEEEGLNGVLVGAAATSPAGDFSATFGLPTEFASLEQLIIRLEAPEDYFAWAQFLNQ